MYPLAQSAALTVPFFAHDANGDGVTGMVDGGFTKRISKNGAAYGAMTVTITEMENGWYSLPVGAGHSDTLGVLSISLSNASAKRVNLQFRVHVRLPDDLAFPATSGRSMDVTAGGAVGVDWANVEGQGTAVNLSATTTNVVNTTTTNTDMVGTNSALLAASAPTNFSDMSIAITSGLVDITQTAADKVWATAARILTANTNFNDPTAAAIADAIWDEVLTLAAHNVADSAGRRLRNLQEFGGYEDGAIWIDTVNGVAGTTDFENGTVGNPTNSIADANTLASSLGLTRFRMSPASTITFVAAQTNQVFIGDDWTLALGGQSIVGSSIIGATVSGIASGTGTSQVFEKCHLNAMSLIKGTHLVECTLEGTQTIAEAGNFFVARCHSAVAGTTAPIWDFGGALTSSNLNFRHYSGGIEIQNMGAGAGSYNMSLEGFGQLVINANCSATSTVVIRGNFTVTDGAGGAVTVLDDARFTLSGTADATWDELLTGSSHNTATSSGRRLREASDAAQLLDEGTAQGGAAGSITLAATADAVNDDIYEDAFVSILSGTGAGQIRFITSYTASTRVADVHENWVVNPNATSVYGVHGSAASNVHAIADSIAAVTNLLADYDGTGYDKSNSTIGTATAIATGGIGSGAIAAAELNNIADGCLDRRLDLGTDSGGDTTTSRTWRQSLRIARNRVAIAAGTMTVYEEDDITADFTAAVTTTAGDPITELNPT